MTSGAPGSPQTKALRVCACAITRNCHHVAGKRGYNGKLKVKILIRIIIIHIILRSRLKDDPALRHGRRRIVA